MESEFGNSLRETLEDGGVIGKDIISSLYLKALRKDFILFIENRSIWLANNICWNLERSEAAEHYGVVIDGIPDIQNNDLIQEIKNKVCVVVNLKILDNDLIHSRHEMGYDPLTGIVQIWCILKTGLRTVMRGWRELRLNLREYFWTKKGKNISFLNETLAPVEDAGEAEEEFDDEPEEEIDIVLETFDADKLVNTCGWVSVPEDMDPHIEESTQEYETKYVKERF